MIKCQVQGKHSSDQVPRAESLPIPDLSQSGKLRQSHLSKMQLSIQQCCNAQKPNSSFIIGIMHGIPAKTFFQLHESLIWWHLNFTSASQGRIWWQIHSPRNKWICMNLLGKCSFTGVCMRTETDQLLQLQMHGCKCQMLARAPSIQWMLHLALLKQGCQADCRALASTGPVALGKWSIFAMVLASLPRMSPSACSPWLHCKRRGHWPSRGSLANSYWVAVPSKWHIGAKRQGSRLGQ